MHSQTAIKSGSFDGARDDIEAALKFDPNYGMAVALKAQYKWQMTLFTEVIAKHVQDARLYRDIVAKYEGSTESQPTTAPASRPSIMATMAAVATTADSEIVEREAWEKFYKAVTEARSILTDYLASTE